MRIRGEKLKRLSEQTGIGVEELASSIDRTGLTGERAAPADKNWAAGCDHPRCKAADIASLAQTLGCEVRELATFTSGIKFHRGSDRKARLVVDMIRGKPAEEALSVLSFSPHRAAVNVKKALAAEPEDRYADASDLAREIGGWLQGAKERERALVLGSRGAALLEP